MLSITSMNLAVVFAFVLLSHVFFALVVWHYDGSQAFHSPDTASYVVLAKELVSGSFATHGSPEIFRTPGYPIFLIPSVALGHFYLLALTENLALFGLAAFGIYKVTASIFNSEAGLYAMALYSVDPISLLYSEKILSETTFTAICVIFLWGLAGYMKNAGRGYLVLSSVALVCATYVRALTIYFPLFLIPVLLLFPRTIRLRQRLTHCLIFVLIFGLAIGGWVGRNSRVAGYHGFSSVSDFNLYFYSAGAVMARLDGTPFSAEQVHLGMGDQEQYLRMHPEQRAWTTGEMYAYQGRQGIETILRHPLMYTFIHLRGCLIVLADPGATVFLRTIHKYPETGGLLSRVQDQGMIQGILWLAKNYTLVAVVMFIFGLQLFVYYGLFVAGLFRIEAWAAVVLTVFCVYVVLVSGGPAAVGRFRVPVMPVVCISAGIAIASYKNEGNLTARQLDKELGSKNKHHELFF
jgi:4-amino-4-deoxy-L-arabinose transferase-like glycosyltransferase